MKTHIARSIFLSSLTILGSGAAFSQVSDPGTETALLVTGALTAFFVVMIFFIIFVLRGNIDGAVEVVRLIWRYVIPQKTEEALQMDETFDGISELDNRVPPWFNYLFGATILFAVIYLLNYHVWKSSPLPQSEYMQELADADIARRIQLASDGQIDVTNISVLTDDASLKEGMEKFKKNCVSCHGEYGEGKVGPNLTDRYWIHGGGIKNIFTTITDGVPAKGMISWKMVFTPKEIQRIASYVQSLQGTNPPNAKPPDGSLYAEPSTDPKDSTGSVQL